MLHFEGDKDLPLAPADVAAKLGDARFLVQCIPGTESVALAEADRAVCTVRPGFAFVRGTLEATLRVVEASPTSARLVLSSKGIGSSSEVEIRLTYTAQDGGTRVHWAADITKLGGLLKAVPQGLIRGAAQRVIDDIWANVAARLSAAST